jgi:hypothetical protein
MKGSNFLSFFAATLTLVFVIRWYMRPTPADTIVDAPTGKLRGVLSKTDSGTRTIEAYYGG